MTEHDVETLISRVEEAELPAAAARRLLAVAIRRYAATVDVNGLTPAFPGEREQLAVTATEAAVAVSGILKELNIELFELAMWQTHGGAEAAR